jgi:hypothetical protein
VSPTTLQEKDVVDIQRVVDKYGVRVEIGGSRAQGRGRLIDRHDLPVDKDYDGPGTSRSDIDFIFDASHPRAKEIMAELRKVGGGAGSKHPDSDYLSTNPKMWEEKGDWRFRFEPSRPPQILPNPPE